MIRTVDVNEITENIREMCIEANHFLSPDMGQALSRAEETEESPLGRQILGQLKENLAVAAEEMIPHLSGYRYGRLYSLKSGRMYIWKAETLKTL